MIMEALKKTLRQLRVIPVIKVNQESSALPLVDALKAGGLPIAEITYRSAAAPGAIKLIRKQRPDIIVGAGTILTIDQAKSAMDSGASFLVSPGFHDELVEFALSQNIPIIPGVNSPTQVEMGLRRGLGILKFFPAEVSGGVAMLKALASVYEVQFMPTGGIHKQNLLDYLSLPNVIACGGSWMVKPEMIDQGRFDEITQLTQEAVELAGSC